ncbi:MAG: TetR family transcriptional regulator [Actinomycetota bacterium]|nr:TetR family transcriptional regulator [Actinomycetota bacterium]
MAAAVRSARVEAGLSMRELAARTGVSAGTICAIEKGTTGVTVTRLADIAAALDVTPARLLAGHDPAPAGTRRRTGRPPPAPQQGSWRSFPPLPIDSVLQGAIDCFVDVGYHATSMRTLAAHIGVSVSSIYHHYPDKQQLLVRVLDVTMRELDWRIEAARREAATSSDEVALIVEALALFHTYHRKLAFIGASEMRSLEGPNRRRITRARDRVQYVLDEAIDQAIVDGYLHTDHPRAAGRAITTMCTSLPQWFRAGGALSPEDIARSYVSFALSMLGGDNDRTRSARLPVHIAGTRSDGGRSTSASS